MAGRYDYDRETRGEPRSRWDESFNRPDRRSRSWTDAYPDDFRGWGPQTYGQGQGDTRGGYADPEGQRNWQDYRGRQDNHGFEHRDRPGQDRFHGYMSDDTARLRQDTYDREREDHPYARDDRTHGARSRHDDDYMAWRADQLRRLDEDYEAYCRERRNRFGEEFTSWRDARKRSDEERITDKEAKKRAKAAVGSDKLDVTGADRNVTGSANDVTAARG